MKKLYLFLLLAFPLLPNGEFKTLLQAQQYAPVDYEAFFSSGAPNNWEKDGFDTTAWSGFSTKFKTVRSFENPPFLNLLGFSIGPSQPDSLSSFVGTVQLPFILGNPFENGTVNLGPDLSVTARGFFGPNMGLLKYCEIVLQLASKAVGSNAWSEANKLNIPELKDSSEYNDQVNVFSRTALLLGVNYSLVPKILRIGGFIELLSPSVGVDKIKPMLGQILNYSTLGLSSVIKNVLNKINSTTPTPAVAVPAPEDLVTPPPPTEKITLSAGLISVGALAEFALMKDKAFIGARLKRTALNFDKNLNKKAGNLGTREVSIFIRSGHIEPVSWLDLPEIGLNYSMFFNTSSWQKQDTTIGVFAKYRF